MKNQTIAIVVSVLVVVLGIQTYSLFRLNSRVDELTQQDRAVPVTGLSGQPKLRLPVPALPNSDLFNDRDWNPYAEMQRMQDEMEKMFGESFSRFHLNTPLGSLNKSPDIDLQDKADLYLVTVNAPGADESSIKVTLEERVLRIAIKTAQAKDEADQQNNSYRYRERFVGELQRVLTLPGPVDAAKLKTEYRSGVLTITIPKA